MASMLVQGECLSRLKLQLDGSSCFHLHGRLMSAKMVVGSVQSCLVAFYATVGVCHLESAVRPQSVFKDTFMGRGSVGKMTVCGKDFRKVPGLGTEQGGLLGLKCCFWVICENRVGLGHSHVERKSQFWANLRLHKGLDVVEEGGSLLSNPNPVLLEGV